MKKAVILGDSLGMPRINLAYEKTYPFLLNDNFANIQFISKNKRANTTAKQAMHQNILDDIIFIKPDIVFIHLGIVDCAPRLFSESQRKVLSKLKYLGKPIVRFCKKHRLVITKYFPKVYVKKELFRISLESIIKESKNFTDKIFVINILKTSKTNMGKSFGFETNIIEYNQVLEDICAKENVNLIDINTIKNELMLLGDGIHINEKGNEILANTIINEFKRLNTQKESDSE
jgi:lysophospholipase L1-like esterase